MSAFRSKAKILSRISCNDIPGSRPLSGQHENLKTRLNHSIVELTGLTKTGEIPQDPERCPQISISRSLFSLFRKNASTKEGKKNHFKKEAEKEEKEESWLTRILPKQPKKLASQERCIKGPQKKQEVKVNKIPNPEWKPSVVIVTTGNAMPKQKLATGPVTPPTLHSVPPQSVETRLMELQEKHSKTSPNSKVEVDMNKYVQKSPYTEFKPQEKDTSEKYAIEKDEESGKLKKDTSNNGVRKRSPPTHGHKRIDRKFSWYSQQTVNRMDHSLSTIRSNKAFMHTGRKNLQYFIHRNSIDHEIHGKLRGNSLQMQVNKRKNIQAQIQDRELLHAFPQVKIQGAKHEQTKTKIDLSKSSYSSEVPNLKVIEKPQIFVAEVPVTRNHKCETNPLRNAAGDISQDVFGQNDKKFISEMESSAPELKKNLNIHIQQQRNSKPIFDLIRNKKTSNFQLSDIQYKDSKYIKNNNSEIKSGLIGVPQNNLTDFHRYDLNINTKMHTLQNERREYIQKLDEEPMKNEMDIKDKEIDIDEIQVLAPKENMKNWIKRIQDKEKALGNEQDPGHIQMKRTPHEETTKQFTSHNKIKHINKHYTSNDMKIKITKMLAQEKLRKKKTNKERVNKLVLRKATQSHVENNIFQQQSKSLRNTYILRQKSSITNKEPVSQAKTQLTVQESLTKYLSERLKSQRSPYSSTNQKDILRENIIGYTKAKVGTIASQEKLIQPRECTTCTLSQTLLHSSHTPNLMSCSIKNKVQKNFEKIANKPFTSQTISSVINSEQNTTKTVTTLLQKNIVKSNSKPARNEKIKKHSCMTFVNEMHNSLKEYPEEISQCKNVNGNASKNQQNNILEEEFHPTDNILLIEQPEMHHNMTISVKDNAKLNKNQIIRAETKSTCPTTHSENIVTDITTKPNNEQSLQNNHMNENLPEVIGACANDFNGARIENSLEVIIPSNVKDSQMEWLSCNTNDQKGLSEASRPEFFYETIMSETCNSIIPKDSSDLILNKTWTFADFAAYFYGTMFSKSDMLSMYFAKLIENQAERCNLRIDNILNSNLTNHSMGELVQNENIYKESLTQEIEGIEISDAFNSMERSVITLDIPYIDPNKKMDKASEGNFQHTSQTNISNTVTTHSSISSLQGEVQCSMKRNYSSWNIKEPYNTNHCTCECKSDKVIKGRKSEKSKKHKRKDNVRQLDCEKQHTPHCRKIHMPGCRAPALKCADEALEQLPCVKREPPYPSFSECLKPFGKKKLSECDCHSPKWSKCPKKFDHNKQYDACPKKEKSKLRKKDICDKDSDDDDDQLSPC